MSLEVGQTEMYVAYNKYKYEEWRRIILFLRSLFKEVFQHFYLKNLLLFRW